MPFLQNKTKRLLVPYVFVTLIWVAPISAYYFNWNFIYVVKKYVFAIDPSQLWFLWMLFDVFAIVWPIRQILLRKPIVGWVAALALYGVGTVGKQMLPNVFCIWTACQYVSFFFIGIRIRIKQEKGDRLFTATIPWTVWIVFDLLLFIGEIVIRNLLACHLDWENSRNFKKLSSYSMPMYLFHQQIIYFCIFVLNGKVNPWINAMFNFIIAIICSFIISAIFMHNRITRFLIGEK